MKRILVTLLLASAVGVVGCSGSSSITGDPTVTGTMQVDPSGSGDFTTIQAAVNQAAPGTVIEVRPGVYTEKVIVDKNVKLMGSGPSTEVQFVGTPQAFSDDSSDNSEAVLEIRGAADVVIENMKFSGPQDGLIIRNCQRVTIRNILASNNGDDGLDIRNSQSVTVSGTFTGNGDRGIQVREGSSDVRIENAEINNNVENGIRVRESSSVQLLSSSINGNGDDGVEIRDSSGVTIQGNTITGNQEFGIRIRNSPNTVQSGNTLSGNVMGDVRNE